MLEAAAFSLKAAVVREGLYEHRSDDPPLSGQVEGDDIHLKAGQQGYQCRHRPARKRALKHITPGSRIDTDSWRGYNWLKPLYDHRSVKHSECYVKDGVHCNTAEAEWSLFKPWWATFRGVAKRHLYLYLAQYEFKRNRRHQSALSRLETMIGYLYAYLFWLFALLRFAPSLP